jgi:hypothetical protein
MRATRLPFRDLLTLVRELALNQRKRLDDRRLVIPITDLL